MAYIGNKPANKAIVASDLDPAVITGQTALATSPADTDEFLISDAGTLKRLDASLIGGGGKVLQAIQGTTTSTTSTSSTSFVVTGLTVDITPAATSSKILLMACGVLQGGGGVSAVSFFDDNNSEVTGTTNGILYTEETGHRENVSFSFLHSPSSTNELTYKVCLKNGNGSATHFAGASTKATIIAIEIGA
jgi:hypothetical protein